MRNSTSFSFNPGIHRNEIELDLIGFRAADGLEGKISSFYFRFSVSLIEGLTLCGLFHCFGEAINWCVIS